MSRIGRLTARIAVPGQGDLPVGTLDRVGVAVTERVPAALKRRLPAPADPTAGGSAADRPVVLIRRLQVSAAVPATASADEIAERLADRLARALLTAPDDSEVRYPSRAAHIAAFVAAASGGAGGSWVFDSFDGVRLLAPLTALRVLCDRYAVPVVAVLAELSRTDDLRAVLSRASPAELSRTWAACLAVAHPPMEVQEARRHLGSEAEDDTGAPARPSVAAMSLSLAARAFSRGASAGAAAAAAAALVGPDLVSRSPVARRDAPSTAGPVGPGDVRPGRSRGADPALFDAAGAPAFLLLGSFENVGLGRLTPNDRALVLAAATQTSPEDPAVALAAGLDSDGEQGSPNADDPPPRGGARCDEEARDGPGGGAGSIAAVVQQALVDDDRLGMQRLQTHRVGEHTIVADATSGIWLAALGSGDPVESALLPALRELPRAAAEPDHALAARIAADVRFLLGDDGDRTSGAVAVVARAGLGHFARRLGGFGASSLPYLADRFLPPGGVVADLGKSLEVRLPAPPLLVVLALAGLDRTTVTVPWLAPTVSITHEDTG